MFSRFTVKPVSSFQAGKDRKGMAKLCVCLCGVNMRQINSAGFDGVGRTGFTWLPCRNLLGKRKQISILQKIFTNRFAIFTGQDHLPVWL